MKKTTLNTQLQELINILEAKQAKEEALLIIQFKLTYESLKPISLIKSTIVELTSLSNLNGNFFDTSVSLVAGFISKKILIGSTHNPIKQIFGGLVQMGVTSFVSKNKDDIRTLITKIIPNVFSKKQPVS